MPFITYKRTWRAFELWSVNTTDAPVGHCSNRTHRPRERERERINIDAVKHRLAAESFAHECEAATGYRQVKQRWITCQVTSRNSGLTFCESRFLLVLSFNLKVLERSRSKSGPTEDRRLVARFYRSSVASKPANERTWTLIAALNKPTVYCPFSKIDFRFEIPTFHCLL